MFSTKNTFKDAFQERYMTTFGKNIQEGTKCEFYKTLTNLILDEISRNRIKTSKKYRDNDLKEIYYFSIEFLPGRMLLSHLFNLDCQEQVKAGLDELGIELEDLIKLEEDPGLGNGGLGRLAAAFLDSFAALGIAGYGMGLRYRYGLFEQAIVEGRQVELPDNWLRNGYPWEYRRDEEAVEVKFGGNVRLEDRNNKMSFIHENYEVIKAVPYDVPITGYKNEVVNFLRLWNAEPVGYDFDFRLFSIGDYNGAVSRRNYAEAITNVLYPDDSVYEGRKLRLKQQYFFTSAGLISIIRKYKEKGFALTEFSQRVAIHINDTHPVLVIPELMRILMDEEGMGWDEAWKITVNSISYTNHTTLPEALEKWSIDTFRELLPRIYMIVEEINKKYCQELLLKYPHEQEKIRELSILESGQVKMGSLAIVGSNSVNGVARIHTEILKKRVMKSFYDLYPEKFNNKTNGITHRRWLFLANSSLESLISNVIGPHWIKEPNQLSKLIGYTNDKSFQHNLSLVKAQNKKKLAKYIFDYNGLKVDAGSIFDAHVKRIHAYKRQLMNVLHIMYLYNRLKEDSGFDMYPRTFIFAGKAAPGYFLAKDIIKLINSVADIINGDKDIKDKMKVIFLENYNVSLGEIVFPSADVSEQISTASKEASGTGNMKFMMNGAITLGTLDGANVEIREQVGERNIVTFGLTSDQVMNYHYNGGYCSWEIYNNDPKIRQVVDQLISGFFPGHEQQFKSIYDHLLYHNDEYFVLKDFNAYVKAQQTINEKYQNKEEWTKMCLFNIAYSGVFSSDRTIKEYTEEIWHTKGVVD